jgi:RimJ/RimL family protein N-acetyltransferase
MDITLATPRGPITVREATEADAPDYREARLQALHDHPEVYGSDYRESLAQPMAFWTERLRTGVAEGLAVTYLAWREQDLVGMCGIHRQSRAKTRHSGSLAGLYVRPGWRGIGIADALLAVCLDWARAHQVVIVKLSVVTTNEHALRCYERNGFRAYGTEPKAICYAGRYYDELLMVRTIPSDS